LALPLTMQAQTTTIALNAGGSAVTGFSADNYYSGGSTYSTTATVTTSGVTNAAPMAVYQTERFEWGSFSYTIPGLTSGATYTVRLHFAEIYFDAAGKRQFNVAINGAQVLSAFDVFATAGGKYKAVVREFSTTANSSGQIVIAFSPILDNPKISGIQVIGGVTATSVPATATRTNTPLPPTATRAATTVPPTATRTNTPVPTVPPPAGQPTPTQVIVPSVMTNSVPAQSIPIALLTVRVRNASGAYLNNVQIGYQTCAATGSAPCASYSDTGNLLTANRFNSDGIVHVLVSPDMWYRLTLGTTVREFYIPANSGYQYVEFVQ
jgi:hypothetical protein